MLWEENDLVLNLRSEHWDRGSVLGISVFTQAALSRATTPGCKPKFIQVRRLFVCTVASEVKHQEYLNGLHGATVKK